jgi:hypothetical protein
VIEDAYSDDEIMTRAELHIYWDILFSSCYTRPVQVWGKMPCVSDGEELVDPSDACG